MWSQIFKYNSVEKRKGSCTRLFFIHYTSISIVCNKVYLSLFHTSISIVCLVERVHIYYFFFFLSLLLFFLEFHSFRTAHTTTKSVIRHHRYVHDTRIVSLRTSLGYFPLVLHHCVFNVLVVRQHLCFHVGDPFSKGCALFHSLLHQSN